MTPETHAVIRTAALVVAAAALVVSAWSAYRVAVWEEEQACWAWISATADEDLAVVAVVEANRNNRPGPPGWPLTHAAYDKMRAACKAL